MFGVCAAEVDTASREVAEVAVVALDLVAGHQQEGLLGLLVVAHVGQRDTVVEVERVVLEEVSLQKARDIATTTTMKRRTRFCECMEPWQRVQTGSE